jgi:peptidoglycan/LPS O-acetylase OafA/YrhL
MALFAFSPAASPVLARLDRAVGHLSYPIYLNHAIAGMLALHFLPVRPFGLGHGFASLAVSIVLSIATYWLVDRNVERFRLRIRPDRPTAGARDDSPEFSVGSPAV